MELSTSARPTHNPSGASNSAWKMRSPWSIPVSNPALAAFLRKILGAVISMPHSPALAALGLDAERARRVMRISFSRETTLADVEAGLEALSAVAPALEALS